VIFIFIFIIFFVLIFLFILFYYINFFLSKIKKTIQINYFLGEKSYKILKKRQKKGMN